MRELIKKIRVTNFKSFHEMDIDLGQFTVLIGANASGKSNFVNALRFLRDIESFGLDNAVSLQGGIEYLRNLSVGADQDITFEITVGAAPRKMILGHITEKEIIGLKRAEVLYRFSLRSRKTGSSFSISSDQLTMKGEFYLLTPPKGKVRIQEAMLGQGELSASVVSSSVQTHIKLAKEAPGLSGGDINFLWGQLKLPPKTLLMEAPFFGLPIGDYFSIFDFDPKLPRKATPITGKAELEEDGSNLAIVLQKILESRNRRRKFSNLVESLLPFIQSIDVEKFADRSLMFKVREKYFRDRFMPASSLSDGTINVAALIAAVYFNSHPLVVVEEPERNIHPSLISKIVRVLKDASRIEQIVITTQNPEVVKHAGIENLVCVARGKDGVSSIRRPSEQRDIRAFLENDIGIETLYVQNILECKA